MADPESNEDFPNNSQRYAFCMSKWSRRNKQEPGSEEDDADQSQPASPDEQRSGSRQNKPGSAATGGGRIRLSATTNRTLRNKLEEHNEKVGNDPSKRTTLRALQAVYRRGAGAFSTSHRPGMTRAQWAVARVNHFLHLLETGKPKDPKYITDNDLLPENHPAVTKAEGYIAPKAVREQAELGLRLRRRWRRGGLSVQQAAEEGVGSGVQRAVNLKNGDRLSIDTIRMMRGFFSRHQRNFKPDKKMPDGGPTAGTIAWYLWGGTPGRDWANKIWEEYTMNKSEHDLPAHFGGGDNIDVYGYKTENFDICYSAVMMFEKMKAFNNAAAEEHIVAAAKYLDAFFAIEKAVVEAGVATDAQGDEALALVNLFAYQVGHVASLEGADLEKDMGFIKMHFDEIGRRMGDSEEDAKAASYHSDGKDHEDEEDEEEEEYEEEPRYDLRKRLALWGSTAGKSRVAKRTAAMIPEHKTYVEPFAGGAAVFYAKAKDVSQKEVLADTNSEIAFSLKFIRDINSQQYAALKRKNWIVSKENAQKVHDIKPTSPASRFYRFAYKRGAMFFRNENRITAIDPAKAGKKLGVVDRIGKTKERLKGVEVYHASYEKMFSKYDGKDTFYYLDPPYPKIKQEVGEESFDEDAFIQRLSKLKGKFILHYDARSRKKFLNKGWNVKTISVFRTAGGTQATQLGKLLEVTNFTKAAKSEATPVSIEWSLPICKVDEDRKIVTGIVLEPDTVDAQGDIVSPETIEEAAYKFLSKYNASTQLGVMHKLFGDLGMSLVESWIAKTDIEVNGQKAQKGSWMMSVRVDNNDSLWKKIKEGKITGFSIGGVARVSQ